jgi:phenylalanyl-tRNA synthetase beta chain
VDRLFSLPLSLPAVREISRLHPVRRDFSLIVPESVRWADLDSALANLALSGVSELVDWRVREVLRNADSNAEKASSETAGEDYSMLVGVTFQAPDHTLRDEEIQVLWQRVVDALATTGARLRG